MSTNDDFWTRLASQHTNTVLAGSMDSHLSGKSIEESFSSVRTLTDRHRAANALSLPVEAGTKVVFAGGMGAYLAYDDVPADGATGEVVKVKSATGEITHHDGNVFVQWDDGKFRGIHAEHLRLAGQDKQAEYRSLSPNEHEQLLDEVAAEVKKHSRGDEIWAWDVVEALGKKYSVQNVESALKYLAEYRGIVKKSPRFNRLMWIKKGSQDKQASGYTVKVRRDGGRYWIEARGELVGPFTAADALEEVDGHLKNPDVVVMGRNHSLGRSGAADAYSTAPFVIFDLRGDVVDEGYSLESLWNKWFDRFLGWRMASSIKTASLGDLTQFLKRADGKLVHKSTNDLWSYSKDADGNFLVSRLFDDEGEPLKG